VKQKKVPNPGDEHPESSQAMDDSTQTVSEEDVADAVAAEMAAARDKPDTDLPTELAEARGRALRAQAELENFRKRIRRDMDAERRYAALPLIRDLLPVIDNLDRALSAVELDDSAGGLLEGVQMVSRQLQSVLHQHHCQVIDAAGMSFDPMCHEAIAEQPSNEYPAGTVMEVAQIGYRLHDRVIRPTQVIVSKGPADQTSE
jgi:molecular chaperone GrpE